MVAKNFNYINDPIRLNEAQLLFFFFFGLWWFWLDVGESAVRDMTKMIHGSPEDGALTLSGFANSLISWRLHGCKSCVRLTFKPRAHVVGAVMLPVGKLWHRHIRKQICVKGTSTKELTSAAGLLGSYVPSRDSKSKHHNSIPRRVILSAGEIGRHVSPN